MRNKSTTKSRGEPHSKVKNENSEMLGLCHVGIYAKDPAALAEFYRDVMDMQLVGGSDASHPLGPTAFLSGRPGEESHELAIFSNPVFVHHAFKVRSLAALKQFYDRITGRGIPVKFQFNHGVSIAFYFEDPEGNLIEVYWRTPVEHPQGMVFLSPPCVQETDLTRTEGELLEELRLLTRRMGTGFLDNSHWAARIAN